MRESSILDLQRQCSRSYRGSGSASQRTTIFCSSTLHSPAMGRHRRSRDVFGRDAQINMGSTGRSSVSWDEERCPPKRALLPKRMHRRMGQIELFLPRFENVLLKVKCPLDRKFGEIKFNVIVYYQQRRLRWTCSMRQNNNFRMNGSSSCPCLRA